MTDPQVLIASKMKPRESLLDKLIERYDFSNRTPAFPFRARLVIAGMSGSNFSVSRLEQICSESSAKADVTNPFFTVLEKASKCSSIIIDYGNHFLQLIEGDERHIFFYASDLRSCEEKGLISSSKVLFIDDDVTPIEFGWVVLNKLPSLALGDGIVPEKSREEVRECICRDITNLLEICNLASCSRVSQFADNLKVDHPKLFPRSEVSLMYIKSNLFLTLEEFGDSFCKFPEVIREVEINHPKESLLKF